MLLLWRLQNQSGPPFCESVAIFTFENTHSSDDAKLLAGTLLISELAAVTWMTTSEHASLKRHSLCSDSPNPSIMSTSFDTLHKHTISTNQTIWQPEKQVSCISLHHTTQEHTTTDLCKRPQSMSARKSPHSRHHCPDHPILAAAPFVEALKICTLLHRNTLCVDV
jgi:hypothetical protein